MITIQILDNLLKDSLPNHVHLTILLSRQSNKTLENHDLGFNVIRLQCFDHSPNPFLNSNHITDIIWEIVFIGIWINYVHLLYHDITDNMTIHSEIQNTAEIVIEFLRIANILDRLSTETTDTIGRQLAIHI